ncbi:MAG: flagellar protein FliS [Lachnospiraceae bacterium]|nr:flagellar protein FliS [Lachnospiraceae bacterium]
MTAEEMNVYKMRITQAGVAEYTIVMLEMEMQWIDEAVTAFEQGNMDEYEDDISKAQSTQVELMNVLNMENAVAVDMYSVFVFINKLLIQSKIKRQPQELGRCRAMLAKFHKSLKAIADTDTAGPMMEQSEKIYAGLTYGAHGLVENSMGGHDYSV